MKAILLFSVTMLLGTVFSSCKKAVDKQKENYVLGVLTDGHWFLESYIENDIDVTYLFIDYEFQFYESGKLDAITASSTVSGTWKGDVTNLTVTIDFPPSNSQLLRLNHVWQWVKSNVGLVFAEYVTPSQKISIRLRKK